eukprot:scaffold252887_cov31-Tisochrysis_lutea.AAC.1
MSMSTEHCRNDRDTIIHKSGPPRGTGGRRKEEGGNLTTGHWPLGSRRTPLAARRPHHSPPPRPEPLSRARGTRGDAMSIRREVRSEGKAEALISTRGGMGVATW